jgi:hypothetical protein
LGVGGGSEASFSAVSGAAVAAATVADFAAASFFAFCFELFADFPDLAFWAFLTLFAFLVDLGDFRDDFVAALMLRARAAAWAAVKGRSWRGVEEDKEGDGALAGRDVDEP